MLFLYLKLSCFIVICAIFPLYFCIKKSKDASIANKIKYFTGFIIFLTFDLILFGVFTRLTDSGLGCPDWPGCFATTNPFSASHHINIAESISPNGYVTTFKAWVEMIHRYMAATIGFLIIILNLLVFKYRKKLLIKPCHAFSILLLIIAQGAFGAFTVTLKLQPIIVSTHFLLAILLISSLICLFCMQKNLNEVNNLNLNLNLNLKTNTFITKIDLFKKLILCAVVFVIIQIALGAWVSSNYAMLGCTEFPTCIKGNLIPTMSAEYTKQAFSIWRKLGLTTNGDVLSFEVLSIIHFTHRCMAFIVFIALVCIYTYIYKKLYKTSSNIKIKSDIVINILKLIKISSSILIIQIILGISTVFISTPLLIGLLHSAGATLLIASLIFIYWELDRLKFIKS